MKVTPLTKRCPHCQHEVSVRSLVMVPREATSRWYQLTPAPHKACPKCGGYVVHTMDNSPWLILLIAYMVILIGSLALSMKLGDLLISWWGVALAYSVFGIIFWREAQHSELIREQ